MMVAVFRYRCTIMLIAMFTTNLEQDWYCSVGQFNHGIGNCADTLLPMLLIACLLSNTLMNLNCNCLVLQSGERRKATIGRDSADGTKTVEGLPFYEMELATYKEDLLLVSNVGAGWMHSTSDRCGRHNA